MTNPHACGNGATEEPAETCDDGNTVDESTVDTLPPDACPANCRIATCPSITGSLAATVHFSSASSVAGYKVFVDYPEAKVSLPGTGPASQGRITNDPTHSAVLNDIDYGAIVIAGGLNAIPPSTLFVIQFDACTASPPSASEFGCTVHQANDSGGNDVTMTC